jgi:adenosylcobinamide-phosphate synthase
MSTCALYPIFVLAAAWLLDALIGDPEKLPHPVRAIGAYIGWIEIIACQLFGNKKVAGVFIGLCVPAAVFIAALAIIMGASGINTWLGMIASCILIYYCISTRCLGQEALAVLQLLRCGDIPAARLRLARIVGRDTGNLSVVEIARAAIETVSENTVDGIISPLFYAALGGAPLAMAFKAVSTLDSMVGYKNEKYRDLGCFSARFDDILNYIPARLCLVLVPLASLFLPFGQPGGAFKTGMRDCRNSPSPNSGFPEACFAGSLGIQLGGDCAYGGIFSHKPFMGDKDRDIEIDDIQRAVNLMWIVSALALLLFTGAFSVLKIVLGC